MSIPESDTSGWYVTRVVKLLVELLSMQRLDHVGVEWTTATGEPVAVGNWDQKSLSMLSESGVRRLLTKKQRPSGQIENFATVMNLLTTSRDLVERPGDGLMIMLVIKNSSGDCGSLLGTTAGRWAWYTSARQQLGSPFGLATCIAVEEGEIVKPGLLDLARHLTRLGCQARIKRDLVTFWREKEIDVRELAREEARRLMVVADQAATRLRRFRAPFSEVDGISPDELPLGRRLRYVTDTDFC